MPKDLLYDKDKVKLLILFILKSLKRPLSKADLTDACLNGDTADFFLIASAMDELLSTGHLVEDVDNDLIVMTKLGESAIDELAKLLPLSVRERAVAKASEILHKVMIAEQVSAEAAPCDGGYSVVLKISDRDFELVKISLFVPTELQAHIICDNFKKSPGSFYTGLVTELTKVRE